LLVGLLPAAVVTKPSSNGATELATRLGPATAAAVQSIVDDAGRKGLPIGSLVSTALEGAARRSAADRIIAAVRSQAAALGQAREAFLGGASEAELVAGASALRAGVPPDSLARLRTVRPGPVVVPLVVLSDMVARGVPPAPAASAVIAARRAGLRDSDLLRLREHVAQDIRSGTRPVEAATVRTQAFVRAVGSETPRSRPERRPYLPGENSP
jgi:hypothetical protein